MNQQEFLSLCNEEFAFLPDEYGFHLHQKGVLAPLRGNQVVYATESTAVIIALDYELAGDIVVSLCPAQALCQGQDSPIPAVLACCDLGDLKTFALKGHVRTRGMLDSLPSGCAWVCLGLLLPVSLGVNALLSSRNPRNRMRRAAIELRKFGEPALRGDLRLVHMVAELADERERYRPRW